MAKLFDQLAALSKMSTAQLRLEWQRVRGEPAPAGFGIDLLARGIAHHLQERIEGGLAASAVRQLERAERQLAHGRTATGIQPALRTGTRLSRDWHGRTHHVLVLDDGLYYRERRYRSLTAIARAITGAAWSGPRFFGLQDRAVTVESEAHHAAA